MDHDPQFRTPDGSALRIWKDTAQNAFQSEKHGRPVFDEVVLCEVISPGSRDSSPVFELVRYFSKESNLPPLYGMKYDTYKEYVLTFEKNEEIDASLAGTPLKEWPEISRSMAASLRSQNIFTVEALADIPDTKLTMVGPDGRTWRDKAQAFLKAAHDASYATELAARVNTLTDDLDAALEREKALASRINDLELAAASATTSTTTEPTPTPTPKTTTAPAAPPAPGSDII